MILDVTVFFITCHLTMSRGRRHRRAKTLPRSATSSPEWSMLWLPGSAVPLCNSSLLLSPLQFAHEWESTLQLEIKESQKERTFGMISTPLSVYNSVQSFYKSHWLIFTELSILLSEKVLRPKPDRAMPQPKRNRQKRGKEVEKAAQVPDTAISRLEMSNSMRRPYLEEKNKVSETLSKISAAE